MKLTTEGNKLFKDGKEHKLFGVNICDPIQSIEITGKAPMEHVLLALKLFPQLNCIRIPILPDVFWKRKSDYIDFLIDVIQKYPTIHFILDYHRVDAYNKKNTEDCIEFWKLIAKVFGKQDNVIFEIFNEPVFEEGDENTWLSPVEDQWNSFKTKVVEPVINAIRPFSMNHIIVGSPDFSGRLFGVAENPVIDYNFSYACHLYQKHVATLKGRLVNIQKISLNNVILFTETGFERFSCEQGDHEGQKFLMDTIIDIYGCGYTAYCCSYNNEMHPRMYNPDQECVTAQGAFFKKEIEIDSKNLRAKHSEEKGRPQIDLSKRIKELEYQIEKLKKELSEKNVFLSRTFNQIKELTMRYGA